MRWCSFIFWFLWRFKNALLSHINWCLALYINCIYFSLWKSYDLLWFWMHLVLCICFESLRRENYLIVWANLLRYKWFKYPSLSFKQIYLHAYGKKGTKAEVALQNLEEKEREERLKRRATRREKIRKGEEQSSSSSDSDDDVDGNTNGNAVVTIQPKPTTTSTSAAAKASKNNVYPDLKGAKKELSQVEEGDVSDEEYERTAQEETPLHRRNAAHKHAGGEDRSSKPQMDIIISDPVETVSVNSQTRWERMKSYLPRSIIPTFKRQSSEVDENLMDTIAPNYRNTYDCRDEKAAKHREKHDRKMLTKKVRARVKAELAVIAAQEKRRKKIASSISLFLSFLRMVCSFFVLVGNVRKMNFFAQVRYVPPHKAKRNEALHALFQMTLFLDVAMFWLNTLHAMCLQWQLCCKIGCVKFLFWGSLLGATAFFLMILPMNYVSDELDPTWCNLKPGSYLHPYFPEWKH